MLNNLKIEICSYQLASGKWNPRVILWNDQKFQVTEQPLTWEKQFKTKEEADKFAHSQAKLWIERNL